MVKIHQIGSVSLKVYGADHLPPHFHVVGADFEAMIEIATLTIIRGELRANIRKPVIDWATAHRSELAAAWTRLNPRFPIA
jgi:hypothetical protein